MQRRDTTDYIPEILQLEELLRAYLHRFAPKPADLEDLLQETYLRLLALTPEKRAELRSIQAFVLTTARNTAVDWLRRRRVVLIDLMEDMDAVSADYRGEGVENLVNAHQEVLQLAAAVAELPARCAEVFTLRKVYGWSQKEIAAHFGISISTVEAHLVKAVRHCTQRLSRTPQPSHPVASWLSRWRRKGGQG